MLDRFGKAWGGAGTGVVVLAELASEPDVIDQSRALNALQSMAQPAVRSGRVQNKSLGNRKVVIEAGWSLATHLQDVVDSIPQVGM